MSIQYDIPSAGSITLTDDNDPSRFTVIDTAGKSEEEINAEIVAFFALSPPPAVTRAGVLARMSTVLGFSVSDLTSFFDGTMD